MNFVGQYHLKQYRNRKLINRFTQKNGIVDEGLDFLLDVVFSAGTPPASWYIGLIDSAGYTGLSSSDTAASHDGWVELEDYDETTRGAWAPTNIGSQTILNSSPAAFTINATKTIKGIFLDGDSTKGGLLGVLWSTAVISPTLSVTSGDVVQVQYQLRAYD